MLGRIGQRLVALCKAFGMKVIATRRNPAQGGGAADEVVADSALMAKLPEADFVVLTCPLTPETTNLIRARSSRR